MKTAAGLRITVTTLGLLALSHGSQAGVLSFEYDPAFAYSLFMRARTEVSFGAVQPVNVTSVGLVEISSFTVSLNPTAAFVLDRVSYGVGFQENALGIPGSASEVLGVDAFAADAFPRGSSNFEGAGRAGDDGERSVRALSEGSAQGNAFFSNFAVESRADQLFDFAFPEATLVTANYSLFGTFFVQGPEASGELMAQLQIRRSDGMITRVTLGPDDLEPPPPPPPPPPPVPMPEPSSLLLILGGWMGRLFLRSVKRNIPQSSDGSGG